MSSQLSYEEGMKTKGEHKVWKNTFSKTGGDKNIPQIQIGQQLVMEEAIRLVPIFRDWIENKSSKHYRTELKLYFEDDQFLLQKLVEATLLLISSSSLNINPNRSATRHKSIELIRKKIMPDCSFEFVWRFLEVLVEMSQYFKIEEQKQLEFGMLKTNIRYSSTLPEIILEKLTLEASFAFFPEPMVEEPLNWEFTDGQIKGGYLTQQYEMIRLRGQKIDYSKYSEEIFDSINYIQKVAWKVNVDVLEVLKRDLKLPLKEDFIKAEYPKSDEDLWSIDLKDETLEISDEKRLAIESKRAEIRNQIELYIAEARDFESALGKYRATKLAIGIAERYQHEEKIYFPHSYDFRGRIYPIPVGLSPQGSDAVKALLEYQRGETLTQWGEQWAWAYLASLYGEDKLPFSERVEFGKSLIDTHYLEADEPYQFLAHQLELKKFLQDSSYEFKGRVHLDACNSGSQFTSAMTRDRAGCEATNVIPTATRQDAYLLVAEKSLALTNNMLQSKESIEERPQLGLFKDLLEKNGRKICKTPVMVSNYGGTEGGRSEILWDLMREFQVDREFITKKNASLYSKIVGQSIHGVLSGGKAFESYIHQMNNAITKENKAITWTTSDGFYVVHLKNKELKPKQVACQLPGSRKITTILKKLYSEDISPVKMKSAISPNVVHSLDAELLRRVALRMESLGIVDTDWIHDSFGCHPNHIDHLLYATKKEFKDLMQSKPLELLDGQLRNQADGSKKVLKVLGGIKIPDLKGFDDSELDSVLDSDWFFS
jgi:DNA-directed RNA polymerase